MCFRTLRHRSPANILCCKIGVFLRKSKSFPLFVRLPPPAEDSSRAVETQTPCHVRGAVVRVFVGPSRGAGKWGAVVRESCRAGPCGAVERRSRRGGAVVRGLVEPLSGGPVAECRRTRAVVRGACVRSYCRAPAPPRQGTPAGYLSGSTWMAIIVPAPKRTRRRCSMSTVSACE